MHAGKPEKSGRNACIFLDSPFTPAYNRSRLDAARAWNVGLRAYRRLSVNKQELIAKVVKDTGLTKVGATAAIESFIDAITRSLKKGAPVTYVGFGTFKPVQRKARTARNPQTGEAIKIPKRRAVRFTAGKALKTTLN
jgi:DNA-binding protein HU-beta